MRTKLHLQGAVEKSNISLYKKHFDLITMQSQQAVWIILLKLDLA